MEDSKNVKQLRQHEQNSIHYSLEGVEQDKSVMNVINNLKTPKIHNTSNTSSEALKVIEEYFNEIVYPTDKTNKDEHFKDARKQIEDEISQYFKNNFIESVYTRVKSNTGVYGYVDVNNNVATKITKQDLAKYGISQKVIKLEGNGSKSDEALILIKRFLDVRKNINKMAKAGVINQIEADKLNNDYNTLVEQLDTSWKASLRVLNKFSSLTGSSSNYSANKATYLSNAKKVTNAQNLSSSALIDFAKKIAEIIKINNLVLPAFAKASGATLEIAPKQFEKHMVQSLDEEFYKKLKKVKGFSFGDKHSKFKSEYTNPLNGSKIYEATGKLDGRITLTYNDSNYSENMNKAKEIFNYSAKHSIGNKINLYSGYLFPYIDDKYRNAYINVFAYHYKISAKNRKVLVKPFPFKEARKQFALIILQKAFQGYNKRKMPDYMVIDNGKMVKIYSIESIFNNIMNDKKFLTTQTDIPIEPYLENKWTTNPQQRINNVLCQYYAKKISVSISHKYLQ